MKGWLIGLGLVILVIVFYTFMSPYRISSEEAKRRIKDKKIDVILDVRTDFERRTLGFYPGSKHIPSAELDKRLSKEIPDKDTRILAYCNTGQRARAAVDKMVALGYKNVVYIVGPHTTLH